MPLYYAAYLRATRLPMLPLRHATLLINYRHYFFTLRR